MKTGPQLDPNWTNLAENETAQTNLAAARPLKNAASSAGGYRLLPLYLLSLLTVLTTNYYSKLGNNNKMR